MLIFLVLLCVVAVSGVPCGRVTLPSVCQSSYLLTATYLFPNGSTPAVQQLLVLQNATVQFGAVPSWRGIIDFGDATSRCLSVDRGFWTCEARKFGADGLGCPAGGVSVNQISMSKTIYFYARLTPNANVTDCALNVTFSIDKIFVDGACVSPLTLIDNCPGVSATSSTTRLTTTRATTTAPTTTMTTSVLGSPNPSTSAPPTTTIDTDLTTITTTTTTTSNSNSNSISATTITNSNVEETTSTAQISTTTVIGSNNLTTTTMLIGDTPTTSAMKQQLLSATVALFALVLVLVF
jgi:hypothetical protein